MKKKILKNLGLLVLSLFAFFMINLNLNANQFTKENEGNLRFNWVKCYCSIIPWNNKCTVRGWHPGQCNMTGDPDCQDFNSNCGGTQPGLETN
jgi:hypothetical protein